MRKAIVIGSVCIFALVGTACSPEVGSEKWCAQMKEKPKGDWTANEASDYTRYCILKTGK